MIRVHHAHPSLWAGHRLRSMVVASAATGNVPLSTSRQKLETECRKPKENGEMPLQMEGA
jgi:hypothetical protein